MTHLVGVQWCMSRTSIEIDHELLRQVMRAYGLRTKQEAVDLALRRLIGKPLVTEQVLALEGSGWDGDLDKLRSG